jgi:serine protease Do
MMRKTGRLRILIVIAVAYFFVGTVPGLRLQLPFTGITNNISNAAEAPIATNSSPQGLFNFVSLTKQLSPAVVNVSTTRANSRTRVSPNPFGQEDRQRELWERFFDGPLPRGPSRQSALGSGFILNREGLILTNNHVVEDAEKIVVRLSDEREFEAKVVGRDPKTDIAVIKIHAEVNLPTAPLGDSDRLEVGEWVLAIGNPFGLEHTVTSGIVSAKGRYIGAGPYDNFIQTDASINPGNSGGPLINMKGEVVGINTAIFSRGGGNIGIGFTIPINLVKELLPQLKEKGKVTRGWMGVVIQRVTPAIAESLGLGKATGALVADVTKGGPADQGGMRVGDLIIEFDGRKVKESKDLPIIVARTPVGRNVSTKVLREGEEVVLSVTIGELKEKQLFDSPKRERKLGLTVQEVTPQIAESLGREGTGGVVVSSIEPGGPGADAGFRPKDVILEIDRQRIGDLKDFRSATDKIKKGKSILVLVQRGETTLFLAVKNR